MNCRNCNQPGAPHEMIEHGKDGRHGDDKKGLCYPCALAIENGAVQRLREALGLMLSMFVVYKKDSGETTMFRAEVPHEEAKQIVVRAKEVYLGNHARQ